MPIPISWPVIGGVPYLVPQTGETNWGALTNYLVALSSAQGTTAQKFGTRTVVSTPALITSATDCVILVNLTVPGPSTVQLPIGVQGQFFIISDAKGDAGFNNITVLPQLGDTINGNPSFVINANDDSITLVFDGVSNWKITSQILSFTPGTVPRASIQAGAPGFVVFNDGTTGLLSEEQFLSQLRGGFGTNVSAFTGVVKALGGAFSASALVDADVSPTANIDATKIGTGIVSNTEFNRLDEIGLLYNTTKVQAGVGSVNGGNPALFDVSAGTAKITSYVGTENNPVILDLNFGPFVGVTVTNLATADITYVLVNSSGALVQQTTVPTPSERRTMVYLFRINHFNRVNISFIDNIGGVSQNLGNQYGDLLDALGSFNITGNVVSPNGANLNFNKSDGSMFSRWFNQTTTPLNPHYALTGATAPTSFIYQTRNANIGGTVTLVDPLNYDVGGVVTLIPGPAATSTIQRVYLFPSNNIRIQYGQTLYATLADAVAAVSTESFVTNPTNVGFPILLAYIIVQKNCVALNASTCRILQAARFDVGAGGGSGGSSTLQNAYLNSVAPILVLAAAPGVFRIRDNAAPLVGSLFAVSDNAAAVQYIDVSTQGIKSNQYPTANRVMVTDTNSAASQSAVTSTEVGFLSGTTGVSGTGNLVRSSGAAVTLIDIDGSTASNTSRITIPKAPYADLLTLARKEGTILYATDLDIFLSDDGITLNTLGTGPGLNTNLIKYANSAAFGWSETGAVFATPATTTTVGDLPLGGIVQSAIQFAATNSAAESGTYNSYSFTTSATMNGKLQVDFFMRPGAGFATNEWTVSVYQGATRQTLENDSGGFSFLPNATTRYTTSFDALANTAYTLRFARTAGAGSATLNVVNVFVGWPFVSQIAPVGNWQTYTPIFGSFTLVTDINMRWMQVGPNINIEGYYTVGSVGAAEVQIGLPNNYTVNTSGTGSVCLGDYTPDAVGTNLYFVLGTSGDGFLNIGRQDSAGSLNRNSPITGGGLPTGRHTFSISVPVSQLAGSVSTAPVPAEEFISSGGTWDADVTGTVYGPAGSPITGSLSALRTKTITPQYPIQNDDVLTIEYLMSNGLWVDEKNTIFANTPNATVSFGASINRTSTATSIIVTFNQFAQAGTTFNSTTGAGNWATSNTSAWRVRKTKKAALPFRQATNTTLGINLRGRYQTKTLAANVTATGAIAGLTFNNLTPGKIYRVSGVAATSQTATNLQMELQFYDGTTAGTRISSVQTNNVWSSGYTSGEFKLGFSFLYTAVNTLMTPQWATGSASGSLLGNGTRANTYVQMEEMDITETTAWV